MLEVLRREIDDCDMLLRKTLLRRMEAAAQIGEYKRRHRLPVYQPEREEQILAEIHENLSNTPYEESIQEIYRCLFRLSRRVQMQGAFPHHIVLAGFMASGKTAVGKELANITGYPCYDVDDMVVKKAGRSIARIFGEEGEGYFRRLESEVVQELTTRAPAIIACGGGCVMNQENLRCLREKGKIVLLKVQAETVYERSRENRERPLLAGKGLEDIRNMIQDRWGVYERAADCQVKADGKTVREVAGAVLEALWETVFGANERQMA